MQIEPYSEKYELDVLELISHFYKESLGQYTDAINTDALKKSIQQFKNTAFLLICDDKCQGLLSGFQVDSFINNKKIFQEVIWYVNEKYRKYGVRLLKEAEKQLKVMGFTTIVLAAMHNSKTEKLFRFFNKMGYTGIETHFIKGI